jgi:DNA-binding MarR family transcriptional regulator
MIMNYNSHMSQTKRIDEFRQRATSLRLALIDGDSAAAAQHQAWLMGEAAAGLLHQDTVTLLDLRAAVADLAPVADHYGDGQRGDRWRTVWELLYAVSQATRPQEQQRLAQADTLSGQLLRLIGDNHGITPGDLATRSEKKPNHISNTLRTLLDQGLVFRVPQGREQRYYPSEAGRQLLGLPQAQVAADEHGARDGGAPGAQLFYLDEERLKRADVNQHTVPGWPRLVAGGGR